MGEASVLCFTWNVGNAAPVDTEHHAWIPAGGRGFDLVVVGTQESAGWDKEEKLRASHTQARGKPSADLDGITLENVALGAWERLVLGRLGGGWAVVRHVALMGMRLTVYARREAIAGSITNVRSARSATGLGGQVGNKGGCVIGLTYGALRLGFASCHLAAHMGEVAARNADFYEVLRETSAGAGASPTTDICFSFDHLIFMGDLNYRLQLGGGEAAARDTPEGTQAALALAKGKRYAELLRHDQLRLCQAEGTAFLGFREGAPVFPPTFKVERQAGVQFQHKRTPSYCDRVLWKSMPAREAGLVQTYLGSLPAVSTSDHKPVLAHFRAAQPPPVLRASTRDAPRFPVVRLSAVRVFLKGAAVDFGTRSCDPYAVLHSHPPRLLGDEPPCSAALKGVRSVRPEELAGLCDDPAARRHLLARLTTAKVAEEDARYYAWAWSDRQLPLLRPRVLGGAAELGGAALVLAMFDRDRVTRDDRLGTVAIGLGRPPDGCRGGPDDYSFDVSTEMPWEGGIGWFTCTVSVALGGAIPAALERARRDRAGALSTSLSSQRRGLGSGCAGGACDVQ